MSDRKKIFLIDGMNMAYRNFFALGQANLTTSSGQAVSCVLGTALFMNRLFREEKPDYIAVLMDTAEPTFRHEQYEDYKGNREEMPDDLSSQLPFFVELLECYGCSVLSQNGYEADDLIGTLVKKLSKKNCDIYIVSGDKDFCQLVDENTFIYSPKKGGASVIIDGQAVKDKFSCAPNQIVDCLAIIGDAADNIPGINGIGIKGAGQLIGKFGSLDGIYKNIEKVTSQAQRKKLLQDKEQAYKARELIKINTTVPMKTTLADLACDSLTFATNDNILNFYKKFEFESLISEVEKLRKKGKAVEEVKPEAKYPCHKLESKEELDSFLSRINQVPVFSFFLIIEGETVVDDTVLGVECCVGENEVYFIDFSKEFGVFSQEKKSILDQLCQQSKAIKVTHNIKQAFQVLSNLGIEIKDPVCDLEIMDYLLEPNTNKHDLKTCLKRYLGEEKNTLEKGESAGIIFLLYEMLSKKIADQELSEVLEKVELPVARVLADVEKNGLYVDCEFLKAYSKKLKALLEEKEQEIYSLSGETFNISSPKQLQAILYDKLNIHEKLNVKIKKTKTGYSTDESVLLKLSEHKLPKLVLEYRSIAKLKHTYVDALPNFVQVKTGRIHTHLRQTVTATGRLSSDRPNLQNIPMRTEMGRKIREAFVVQSDDHVIISADYSQIEIRLLCHFAKPSRLSDALHRGYDIHLQTAAEIFSLPSEQVTREMRSYAKAINFGIIYGMGPRRLAQEINVSTKEAKAFIETYFATYPQIKKYSESLVKEALTTGYATTIVGRKRAIPGLQSESSLLVSRAENMAVNTPLQGSAADLIKLAMIQIDRQFREKEIKAKMVLQIHDELLFECHKSCLQQAKKIIVSSMEHALELTVPLKVEIQHGKNWLDAHS